MKHPDDPTRYVHRRNDDNNFVCRCRGQYAGRQCEIPYLNCGTDGLRCYHHGARCQQSEHGASCRCPTGFGGETCEEVLIDGVSGGKEYPSNGNNIVIGIDDLGGGTAETEKEAERKQRNGRIVLGVVFTLIVISVLAFLFALSKGRPSLMRRYRPVQRPPDEIHRFLDII